MATPDPADTLAADLAALKAQGAATRAPLPWHHAHALAQRRLAHAGAVRQQLDARLAALLDGLRHQLSGTDQPTEATGAASPAGPADPAGIAAAAAGPLAALAAHAAQAAQPATDDTTGPAPAGLKAVRLFGGTWARVRLDAQLRRAHARPRGAVGPLNSQRVMLQALQQLQQLSPAYLQHFMALAETLLWLEDSAQAPPPTAPAAKKTSARRPTRR